MAGRATQFQLQPPRTWEPQFTVRLTERRRLNKRPNAVNAIVDILYGWWAHKSLCFRQRGSLHTPMLHKAFQQEDHQLTRPTETLQLNLEIVTDMLHATHLKCHLHHASQCIHTQPNKYHSWGVSAIHTMISHNCVSVQFPGQTTNHTTLAKLYEYVEVLEVENYS